MCCVWPKKKKLSKTHNPAPKHFRNERVLVAVVEYHKYATVENDTGMPDSVPWCASFVAFVLESVGMGSTNNKAARSYLKWGVSSLKNPLPGDIVVFWRGTKGSWQGHVGFLVQARTNGMLYVLGGNQDDAVNIKKFDRSRLLDIRRSSKMHELSDEERGRLNELALKIKMGSPVELANQLV